MSRHDLALLTIILAVKDVDRAQYYACLNSIAALKYSNKICITVVACGKIPEISNFIKNRFLAFNIVIQKPEGVYSAYNRGLQEPLADYVLFIGADDLILPGLDNILSKMPVLGSPKLIAACALMQNVGISKPSKIRSNLIFRNWCQQGLLYNASVFKTNLFDTKYKMQADHKFNMELIASSETSISYHDDIIAHFAHGGISSTIHDWEFRSDMPCIVKSCYGTFWYYIALFKRFVATKLKGYPENRNSK